MRTFTFACSAIRSAVDGRWTVSLYTPRGVTVLRRRGTKTQAIDAAMRILRRGGAAAWN